nr:hypothetical protein [Tanacetum cinerariifolium]
MPLHFLSMYYLNTRWLCISAKPKRFITTQANKKFKENGNELRACAIMKGIINKRKKAIEWEKVAMMT